MNQARALGYCAWLMAQTPLKTQAWKSAPAQITTGPSEGAADKSGLTFKISAPGIDLIPARTVWEAEGREPSFGASLQLSPGKPAPRWVEAEAQLPDGRRVFAAHDFAKLP